MNAFEERFDFLIKGHQLIGTIIKRGGKRTLANNVQNEVHHKLHGTCYELPITSA